MAEMYTDVPGNPPTSPALLAMVMLLQAFTGLSDHDAVVAAQTDLKWRLVLGLLDSPKLGDAPSTPVSDLTREVRQAGGLLLCRALLGRSAA
jgi:hypothetical protein